MALDRFRLRGKPDYLLILTVLTLLIIGLIAISSASVVISYERFGSNYVYLARQAVSVVAGLIAWAIFQAIDYRFWKRSATILLVFILAGLLLVFVPHIGTALGGAHRWINLKFVTIQPSEFVKLAFILYLAAWLDSRRSKIQDFKSGFLPAIFMIGLMILLIILQPDMGTVVVIVLVAAILLFIAGAKIIHLGFAALLGIVLLLVLIHIAPYRLQRLRTFLNPSSNLGSAYQINQSLLAIGNGGPLGLGFGNSRQKYLYLPQAHTDSIFPIIAEELGFLRASFIILIFVVLVLRGYAIAKKAPDFFTSLVAVGITAWILVQTLVNLGAMLGIIPLTGVPLAFISFGGSSIVALLMGIGVLTNISKQISQ